MEEAKEKIVDLKASEVEACRICLATGVKMYSLQDTHLGTCIESIGGFTKSCDGLPNKVCYECAPTLIKCHKLIDKSKTAQATLLDIFIKNGQINNSFIEEQKKSAQKLQSPLDSYLLLNYYHYDDDSKTSAFTNTESDPNERINIRLNNETKDQSLGGVSNSEILSIVNESIEEENNSDSDVEAIEVKIPVIEIMSDDEQVADDYVSLKTYDVQTKKPDKRLEALLAYIESVPHYNAERVKPLGSVKNKGKKKRKRLIDPLSIESARQDDSYVRRYFHTVPKGPGIRTKYFCKTCPAFFYYTDAAKDHTFIGCQHPISSCLEANTAISNQPK